MSQLPDAKISATDSLTYWDSIPTTVDGMLGGYPQISRTDLKGSANFLAKLRKQYPSAFGSDLFERGVDYGAGIGRVTAGFLSTVCKVIDIVEPVEKFAQAAKAANFVGEGCLGKVSNSGLEDWNPEERYDIIWNQWCLGHLKDQQLVEYLRRCKQAVSVHGWIIVKENISTDPQGKDIFDEIDSSVTRTDEKFQRLFKDADIRIMRTEIQRGFPRGLFPVRLYALRP